VSQDINVTPTADASWTAPGPFCDTDVAVTLTPDGTTGGTWSGTGVSDNGDGTANFEPAGLDGTYSITYSVGTVPCDDAVSQDINVTPTADASWTAPGPFCDTDVAVTLTPDGTTGGTWSGTGVTDNGDGTANFDPAGLDGTYSITYSVGTTPCDDAVTLDIAVTPQESAVFTISSPVCAVGTLLPVLDPAATVGGTWSADPDVVIDPVTGEINLVGTPVGTYDITYTSSGGSCSDVFTLPLTIAEQEVSLFTVSAFECAVGTVFPVLDGTATAGGTWTADAGVDINPTTGEIDLVSSTPGGPYNITYTTPDPVCGDVSTETITIGPDEVSLFTISALECAVGTVFPMLDPTATTGGVWTAFPVTLVIDPATGEIDLAASPPGTYTITYTTPDPVCGEASSEPITIVAEEISLFTLSPNECALGTVSPVLDLTSTTGGTWTADAGVVIDPATGEIDLASSTPGGPYTVTYTTAGSDCDATSSQPITIEAASDPLFTYPLGTVCVTDVNPIPDFIATPGGVFTIDGVGVIDAATGEVFLPLPIGVYTITYSFGGLCPSSADFTLNITDAPIAEFTYEGPYCQDEANPFPVFAPGAGAGTFIGTPAGLVFGALPGEVDLAASAPGTYTVTNDIAPSGGCASTSASYDITINALDESAFTYPSTTICVTGGNPIPDFIATAGGTFTSDLGGIDAGTGEVDLGTLSAGDAVTVTYTTSGPCPGIETVLLTITDAPIADFTYGGPYCQDEIDPSPVFAPGASAGTFSGVPGGLVIDPGTGDIDLAASTPGTYTITNDITAGGGCSATTASFDITINGLDDATFTYPATTVCITGGNPIAEGIITTGGTFTIDGGATIDPTTGEVTLTAGMEGTTYNVTYTTAGPCPDIATVSITVTGAPLADFTYGGPYCQSDANPFPVFAAGASAGTLTGSDPGLIIDPSSGEVDLAGSTPGTYTITNTIAASGGCAESISTWEITIDPDQDPTF
ncbi:MAG: hypothetical protein GY779_17465, partial [Gammaproteobacteria bacterium]|nr:hypothetical protein [Gammaproteobacteria bacterium]